MTGTLHPLTDVLANTIRNVDGKNELGAAALAEAILESLTAQSIAVVDIPEPVVDRDGRTRVNLPGTDPGHLSPHVFVNRTNGTLYGNGIPSGRIEPGAEAEAIGRLWLGASAIDVAAARESFEERKAAWQSPAV